MFEKTSAFAKNACLRKVQERSAIFGMEAVFKRHTDFKKDTAADEAETFAYRDGTFGRKNFFGKSLRKGKVRVCCKGVLMMASFILFYIDFTDLTKNCIGGILKERECPNIWSSPQVSFCPKRTQDRYSGLDWAVIFFLFYL